MTKMIGTEEGDICNRDGCEGVIELEPLKNCACHISPPCSACTDRRYICPECGWVEELEFIMNDHVVSENKATGIWKDHGMRPLDNTKIDWHSFSHTHFSMIKRGVCPAGTSAEEVRKLVDGTFGGKFNYFRNGEFEFVAYTD